MQKQFTKDMLETGMMVSTGTGADFLIFKEKNIMMNGKDWNSLDNYDENLKIIGYADEEDIIRVFSQSECCHDALFMSTKYRTILWKRPKAVELTMQEIADKFGVSVDALKIKK